MKASLQLKLGQSLTMTPQLQQAIRLLQLSTLDLQSEIQEALDANPLLELSETIDNDISANETPTSNEPVAETPEHVEVIDSSAIETHEALEKQTINDEL